MAGWDDLSAELRNRIYALVIPQYHKVVPEFIKDDMKIALFFQPMKRDNATDTYIHDGPAIPAAQYAAMMQLNQQARKESAYWVYGKQTFVFPRLRNLDRFIKTLNVYSLSCIRQVSVSAATFLRGWGHEICDTAPAYNLSSIDLLTKLIPLQSFKNLAVLNISLEILDCTNQRTEFLDFEAHGRQILGCGPDINVVISDCKRCAGTRKKKPEQSIQSQHWRWGSAAGSASWEVMHFIGDTQVQSLTQLLKPYHLASVNDPASKQRLVEQLEQKGAELKQTRACGDNINHTHLMPDDLRRSRGYWCQVCELVFYCSYDCTWKNAVHRDYCVPKPIQKTTFELEELRDQYTQRVQKKKRKEEFKEGSAKVTDQVPVFGEDWESDYETPEDFNDRTETTCPLPMW